MSFAESEAIACLARGEDLPCQLVEAVIQRMLSGASSSADMREFLSLMQRKGETVEELVGAATAMRRAAVRIATDYPIVLDTCGTGGDGSQTFNISTAAAIVIAAAGVPVAKHGNRKVTSSTGSADVLAELGIDLDAPPAIVERCLNELKLCFCFAQRFHPAMKHVAEVRRSLSGPTIFNRLGPLCNPASANRQVLGVGSSELQAKLASALLELGTERSLVVRGRDGVDEVSLESPTEVLEVRSESMPGTVGDDSAVGIVAFVWQPSDFGVVVQSRDDLFADSPAASAACIRDALSGRAGACRDAVLVNAAAGLWCAGEGLQLSDCFARAADAIDSGRARELVEQLARLSHTRA